VCYMCYTDVFVGQTDNINNLKSALKAVLKGFNDSNALTQLVHGLCLFMGYPSCLCKPKKSVKESLKKISKELKGDLQNYECLNPNPSLNCNSCSDSVVCKCCVLDCIRAVQGSQCLCVKGTSRNDCTCSSVEPKRCCKDLLEKLKASLSLLNLKADMKGCTCPDLNCCVKGVCTQKDSLSCPVCNSLQTSTSDYTVTGLGLLRPSPKRLAEKLETFVGSTGQPKSGCSCQCNGSKSCCCLACQKCSEACSCKGSSGKCLHTPKTPSDCPRKVFCLAIDGIKIAAEAGDRTCCDGGKKCHCGLEGSKTCSPSDCCVVQSGHYYHSAKCLLRRVVSYFKDLSLDSSNKNCSKICCEIFCVLKTCEFLKKLFNDSKKWAGKDSCGKCKGKGPGKNPCKGSRITSSKCCNGTISGCTASDCCQGCPDCNAIKLGNALQELQYSGPCGQDLYRVLDSFLYYCCKVFYPRVKLLEKLIKEARDSCPNCGKPGKGGTLAKACQCSSSGSCSACQEILKDPQLKVTLTQEYVSSYDSSASLLSSDNNQNAAKIFLGMLPCMYWGLKILYDRAQDPLTWPDWHDISVSNGLPSSDLGRFLYVWGYDLRPLISKKGSEFPPMLENLFSSGSLNSLYEKSKIYFTSFPSRSLSSGSSVPSTVRQMLLWLYGLRFQKHFSDIVENCSSLCSPFGNSFNSDAFCYYIYTCSFILPVAIISLIEDSLSITSLGSEFSKFFYPSDPSDLFEKLCEYARKIFVALAFLYYQCERNAGQGGWNDCAFGRGCAQKVLQSSSTSGSPATSASPSTSSSDCSCPNSKTYLCTAINKDTVHDHCKDGNSCLGFSGSSVSCSNNSVHGSNSGSCKNPCPHPLLRFLIDDSSDSDSKSKALQNFRTPFHSSTVTPMGFSKDNLSSTGCKGEKLYFAIYGFCKDGFYPLTRLVQFILCVSQRPPETLGELFAFFKQFVSQLNSKDFKDHFVQWIEDEPGFYSGSDLKNALEDLFNHSSHSANDLKSLYYCDGPKGSSGSPPTCGKYLHALTEDVSGVFTPKLCSMYLSWICYRAEKFYSEFQKFHKEAEKKFSSSCSHCKSCKKIVECPCALPFIYSLGFTFHSPSGLNCVDNEGKSRHVGQGPQKNGQHTGGNQNCTTKSCSDFITQLKLVAEGDLFTNLLEEIDNFLWSIRKPFFLFVLAFWAFVISYFLYVQLYKLDVLELNSHDHPAWSFKILPSTLFSDASSKLKDLSYFTL
ncbi:variant erythrocyte surface antigen-1 family protein, partial [Babesia divergens]